MPLDDVWRTFQTSVGIFWKGRFDEVPPFPGVYAWFYPLRITSYVLDEFLDEVRKVHLFDPRTGSFPRVQAEGRLGWSLLKWSASLNNPQASLSSDMRHTWDQLVGDSDSFERLRRTILKASLLMPPLYVGKAINLRNRSSEHLASNSDFAKRYEKRACDLDLSAHRVRDLLLITLQTDTIRTDGSDTEALVEEILKVVARPAYGVK